MKACAGFSREEVGGESVPTGREEGCTPRHGRRNKVAQAGTPCPARLSAPWKAQAWEREAVRPQGREKAAAIAYLQRCHIVQKAGQDLEKPPGSEFSGPDRSHEAAHPPPGHLG